MRSAVDPADIHGADWEFSHFSSDGTRRYSRLWIDREHGQYILRTEHLADDELIALNQQQLHDSTTKRFGDGQVVARVPLHTFFADVAPKMKEGDDEHLKWWLNHEKTRPWRCFRGKI